MWKLLILMVALSGCTGFTITSEFDGCNDLIDDKEFCVEGTVTVGDKE